MCRCYGKFGDGRRRWTIGVYFFTKNVLLLQENFLMIIGRPGPLARCWPYYWAHEPLFVVLNAIGLGWTMSIFQPTTHGDGATKSKILRNNGKCYSCNTWKWSIKVFMDFPCMNTFIDHFHVSYQLSGIKELSDGSRSSSSFSFFFWFNWYPKLKLNR